MRPLGGTSDIPSEDTLDTSTAVAADAARMVPRGSRLLGLLALIAITGLAAVLIVQAAGFVARPPPGPGDLAPSFELSGTPVFGAGALILDFSDTTCSGCRVATTKLNRLHNRYGGRGLRVVSLLEEGADTARFRDERDVEYTLRAGTAELRSLYRVSATPTVLVIDGEGRIRSRRTGAIAEVVLDREVRSLLSIGHRR